MEAVNFIEQLIRHFALCGDRLIDRNRLQFTFDANPIQLPINDSRHGVDNIFRHQNANAVFLGESLEARRQIDRVTQHRVGATEG